MKKSFTNNKKSIFPIAFPIITIIGIGIISIFTSVYEESWSFNWNGISENVKDSISIYEYRSISSGVGGMGSDLSSEVERRIWIMNNATESELIRLTEFPNGNIKAIAYEGLLKKQNFEKKLDYALKAIRDTTHIVNYQAGCVVTGMSMNKYITNYVLNIGEIPPAPPEWTPNLGLSDLDKEKILSEHKKYPNFEY